MQLHNLLAQRQTKASTALFTPHLHEGLENTALLAIGNTFAIVFDTDDHPLTMTSGLKANLPAIGGMAQGVIQQVIQHTFKLGLIGIKHRQWFLKFEH